MCGGEKGRNGAAPDIRQSYYLICIPRSFSVGLLKLTAARGMLRELWRPMGQTRYDKRLSVERRFACGLLERFRCAHDLRSSTRRRAAGFGCLEQ